MEWGCGGVPVGELEWGCGVELEWGEAVGESQWGGAVGELE